MLALLSQKTKDGFDIPRKGEKSPLPLVVFFRPQFLIRTGKIRVQFIMVDCLRGLYESARSFAGMSTSLNPPPMLDIIGGGLSSHKGVSAMSHDQTQTKTKNHLKALNKSVITAALINSVARIITVLTVAMTHLIIASM